ncbi:winged helix domain-containing protein [Rhodalgimonas zhirmunskyi]|uniref:winged helix domain-containing protein n=1 Tax=Rhodalgimonas zhirmunskyi TaxID=2964767 RepID=UPI0035304904
MACKSTWGAAPYIIILPNGDTIIVTVSGRDRWMLDTLIKAGKKGCTSLENPAPRISAYVHNLRGLGIPIETITEPHDGPFSGTHARYVLRATVTQRAGRAA